MIGFWLIVIDEALKTIPWMLCIKMILEVETLNLLIIIVLDFLFIIMAYGWYHIWLGMPSTITNCDNSMWLVDKPLWFPSSTVLNDLIKPFQATWEPTAHINDLFDKVNQTRGGLKICVSFMNFKPLTSILKPVLFDKISDPMM